MAGVLATKNLFKELLLKRENDVEYIKNKFRYFTPLRVCLHF
jgi:predicted small secreted protein